MTLDYVRMEGKLVMEKMTEVIVTEKELDEEYVVNGEGCQNDCYISWQSSQMGCVPNAWFTSKF